MKSLFFKDRIESIEWQDLEQRQRIGDCSVNHHPRWGPCGQPLSSHRTFLPEEELRQCVFCKEPFSNFGLSGNENNCCASSILIPLSWDVPNLSREKRVRVQAILCPLDHLWTPPTTQEDLANGRPHLYGHPSHYICFGYLSVIRSSFLKLVRHFALGLGCRRQILRCRCWRRSAPRTGG